MTTAKKIARILLLGASKMLGWLSAGCTALSALCGEGAERLEP